MWRASMVNVEPNNLYYEWPPDKITSRYGLQYHMFAGDCQLNTEFSSTNRSKIEVIVVSDSNNNTKR